MYTNSNRINPPSRDIQTNTEMTDDILNVLPQGVSQIYFEILHNRKNKNESIEQIKSYQNVIKEKQQSLRDLKTKKENILKEIITHQSQLDDTKYRKDSLLKQISKVCQIHNEINNVCIKNENILQQCSQDKITASKRIEETKTKMCDNLTKLKEIHKKKQDNVTLLNESVLNQREAYEQYLTMYENQLLGKREKLNSSNEELEILKRQFDEKSHTNSTCLTNVKECEEGNERLENELKNKQKNSDDLLKQTEELFHSFEQNKKEMFNILDDRKYEIQKKEIEMKSTERGLKNQTEYNKSFREKIAVKEKQIIDQRLQNKKLATIQKEKQTKSVTAVKDFEETIALNSREQENAQVMWSEEYRLLTEAEQGIAAAEKINEELMWSTRVQENTVDELKNKHTNQDQHISACEQKLTSLLSQLDKIKKELNAKQMQIVNYKQEKSETIKKIIFEAKTLVTETEQTKNDQLLRKEAIIQEMNAIKADFDAKTTEQTNNFEEKQKQLQNDIQMIDKELVDMRNSRIELEQELDNLNKNCDTIMQEIKDRESLPRTLRNNFTPPSIFWPPSTVTRASHKSTSSLILPPTVPIRHQFIEELSDSSAEGNAINYQELLQRKRERQRRHQLRELRQQSKNVLHSQNNNVNK